MRKSSFALVPMIAGRVRLLFSLIRDWLSGSYPRTPWYVLCGAAIAVLYVVNPLDLVPDYLPVLGWLDDTVMLFVIWRLVRKDLYYYALWRQPGGRKMEM